MLSKNEINFIDYWASQRNKNKLNPFFFIKGLSLGLLISFLIIAIVGAGWYSRANMQANSKLNPVIFLTSLLLISIFCSVFYNSFKFEQNEQYYNELLAKQKKAETIK
jgi:hypothetical protein